MPSKVKLDDVREILKEVVKDPKEVERLAKVFSPLLIGIGSSLYAKRAVRKLTPFNPSYSDTRRVLGLIGIVAYGVGSNFATGSLIAREAREASKS